MTDALDRRPGLPTADVHERIREAAFALLLSERRPIAPDEVAAVTGAESTSLAAMLDQLAGAGWIDRDDEGRVTGSAGLSLTTGPHRIAIDGTEFRTWCAYDSIGIAAALGADAEIRTACAVCGREIAPDTVAGKPPADRPERLWLAAGGADLRGDFCDPTVLLCSPARRHLGRTPGRSWSFRRAGRGGTTRGGGLGSRRRRSSSSVSEATGDPEIVCHGMTSRQNGPSVSG
jgi:hypothetical protein